MVAIGLCPFSRKRVIGFVAFAFLVLSVVGCFANPILVSVNTTPYDQQMARIQPVLVSTPAQSTNQELLLPLINRWIGELRNIPYGFSMEWKTPAEVALEPVADCKGKAVTLYQQMARHGARGLRLVIGRRAPTSRSTHTWVQWTTASATYILDPTINWTARTLDEVADNSYVPYYAYAGHQKYRAPAASALYARL
jgi:predicted transglutaminase-like cysteine proteinase